MVKYGRTLEGNKIPEWRLYYVNYEKMKQLLKDMDRLSDE